MIKFIYGSYGSGKTTEILRCLEADTKNSIKSFLIIPDQEALQFERLTLASFSPQSQLNLEILGFSRLYNRVCREYGGLSYSYVSKPMRSLLMWKALRTLAPLLEDYGERAIKDATLTDAMLSAINEFKANGVSPVDLQNAARELSKSPSLAARLRDLSMIYSYFNAFVEEKYSDSADDLAKLCERLKEHNFFAGANVYFDSFYSFTSVQHRIIEEIFKSAENVTVTVPLPSPDDSSISNEGIRRSAERLCESAERCGGYTVEILSENMRAKSPALAYLSKNLWHLDTKSSSAPALDGSIIYEQCESRYAEAEAVAASILELLRGGARCKDIVVIARDTEKYRGIIDSALKKSDIPFFFDQKSDMCSMPAVKFILAALRIKKYNWQRQDVLAYLKTGMCNVSPKEANLFEEYVLTWSISGSLFLEEQWTMNPDGLIEKRSERAKEILAAANAVRKKIVEPLKRFFIMLDASETIADMCKATYSYMCELSLEKKLAELSLKAAERNDFKQARELSRIYEITLNALGDIAEALSDEDADTDEFLLILKNIFDKTEIGSIPTSIDEVTVGSASLLRTSNPKYAFVIGLCEGEFPATVNDSGIFSKTERYELEDIGLKLSENTDVRSADELMYIQRAFSAPSDKLFLFTHASEINGETCFPSIAFKRVKNLFENIELRKYKISEFDSIVPSPKNAAAIFRTLEDGQKKESLRVALSECLPEFSERARLSSSASLCRISPDVMKKATRNNLFSSATAFEKYASCPFNYFCSNILSLRQKATSQFRANSAGSFIHYILENLIKHAIPTTPDTPPADDEQLLSIAEKCAEDYLARTCPPSMLASKRMQHLYERLKALAVLLVRDTVMEFSKSDFRPAFFELETNGNDGNPSPLVFSLDNDAKISFSGKIDRVDLYKKDGEVYIRIVDYKTGDKVFHLDDVEYGVNIQLLLYLFTICRSESAKFKSVIGVSADRLPLPAGAVYLSAAIPTIEAEDYGSNDKTLSLACSKIRRSGLLIDEEDILLAMNCDLDSGFLAKIKKNKDGTIKGDALTSAQKFESIYTQLEETIKNIANKMLSGNVDAAPVERRDESPCNYCTSKPICRRVKEEGEYYGGKNVD